MSFRPLPLALLIFGCVGTVGETADETPGSPGAPSPAGGGSGGEPAPGGGAGGAGGAPVGGPAPAAAAFRCDPAAVPPIQAWRKLSTTQYRSSLRDLFTFAVRGDPAAVMNAIQPSLGRMPADERQKLPQDLHGSYRRLDQDVEQIHIDTSYEVALTAAATLTSSSRLGTVVGACATDANAANDADCLTTFITTFGERALRRPLAPEEVTFYRGFYGTSAGIDPAGLADVVAAFLTAPQFLYHVEHGETAAGKANLFTLTAFELASRLSYHFWETMPDTELWNAARSGTLRTPQGFAQQVDRLFADPRSRSTLDEFYRDWLKLDDLKALDARVGEPVFKAFAGDDLPKTQLRAGMIEDVLGMTRHHTWDKPGAFDDLLTSNLSFAKAPELAKIYGVPAWTAGEPPAFPADQRPGLLTRAAFLATGSANTRPVMKGVFTRETILCDEIPPPPDNAMANPPELSPKMSTRQVVEAITEAPGTGCAGCHALLINPIGYATENFDALGRLRAEQRLWSDKGLEVGKAPVDTRSVPQIVPGDMTPSTGAADLMRLIARSGKAQACFARHYFRFTFARWDDPAIDGCVLERLRKAGSLRGTLKEVALAPEFQQRRF